MSRLIVVGEPAIGLGLIVGTVAGVGPAGLSCPSTVGTRRCLATAVRCEGALP